MKNINIKKQVICMLAGVLFALGLTISLCGVKKVGLQKNLAKEVFRFHVLANSDSEEDQKLKLKVKENVIAYMKKQLPESESVEMTKAWARNHLPEIVNVAKETLRIRGCDDAVSAEVTECHFPEKTYGDITFPNGKYEALRIEIGEGKGENWWCVLYPNLCFIDAVHAVVPNEGKKELKEVLNEEEYEMVTTTSKFKIKWFFFQ